MNIHYNITTGQIVSYGHGGDHGDGFGVSPYPDCAVAVVDDQPIDGRTQRFDQDTWKIIAKEEPDPIPDRINEVHAAVRAELAVSDKFMMPDYPISEADRLAWGTYRKALRDASKGNGTASAMLAAIPARPDGSILTISTRITE